MTPDVNVCLANMPCTIKAYTVADLHGTYTIVLNSHLTHQQHRISYYHEMYHILNEDYDKHCDAELWIPINRWYWHISWFFLKKGEI